MPLATALPVAAVTALASPVVLRRLPEPVGEPDAEHKPTYASLATRRFTGAVFALALGSGLIAFCALPPSAWVAWLALVCPGTLAITIDGATTWMPRVINTAMGAVATVGVALWAALDADLSIALRAALMALVFWGVFHGFWFITRGGIGFGDVRLVTAIAAVAAAHSLQTATWALALGSLVGLLWGLVSRLIKGKGLFAFGPALWTGPFLALLIETLASR